MQALWITLGAIAGLILLVILLLFIGKAKVHIVCVQKPKVIASVFGFRFTLVSDDKKEKDAEKDLSLCRNPKRALKKELRRQRKETKKALKKQRKAKKKALRKAEKKKKALAEAKPSPNIPENLAMITSLIKKLYVATNGKIHVHVKKMHLSVATGDAAKTAILYGVVVQSAAYLLQFIQTHFLQIHRKPENMQIRADYLSAKSHVDIDIVISIRLCSALGIGIKLLLAHSTGKRKALTMAKKRSKQKNVA
ncbi:MAG: hypothetical protein IJF33_06355 [Clostridia bacterium]|nr:hypothetical protein [Clostridia bacterium]